MLVILWQAVNMGLQPGQSLHREHKNENDKP